MADTDNQANANLVMRTLRQRPEGMSAEALSRAMKNRLKFREYRDLLAQLVADGQIVFDAGASLYRAGV
jgi:hypothetical protein